MRISNINFLENDVQINFTFDQNNHSFNGENKVAFEDYEQTVGLNSVRQLVSTKLEEEMDNMNFRITNIRSIFAQPNDFEASDYDITFNTPQAVDGNSLNGNVRLTAEEFDESGSLQDKVKAKIVELVAETAD